MKETLGIYLRSHNIDRKISNCLKAQQTDPDQHMVFVVTSRFILYKVIREPANGY